MSNKDIDSIYSEFKRIIKKYLTEKMYKISLDKNTGSLILVSQIDTPDETRKAFPDLIQVAIDDGIGEISLDKIAPIVKGRKKNECPLTIKGISVFPYEDGQWKNYYTVVYVTGKKTNRID